jgi:L-aspartate oxidase
MRTDVLVVGAGIAGASTALELSLDSQRQITVIAPGPALRGSASMLAQGGIVGRGTDDSADRLAEDVLRAGAGLSLPRAVRLLAEEGPELVDRVLIRRLGVAFDRDAHGRLELGLEGAHSRRRILHVGDATGRAIMHPLIEELLARPNVRVLEGRTAVDLLTFPHHSLDPLAVYGPVTCHGAYVFHHDTRRVQPLVAGDTVIATGGIGQIFLNTTNPLGARGDGLAMAYRAGARVIHAEYVQFHPTALHMDGTTKQLISEAVRGEGGVLLTPDGERFMQRYAPHRLELATRDVVARAIYREMLEHGYSHVMLDIASQRPASFIRERFPQIHADCLARGLDIALQPVPVVPAAHYFCGGVLVDENGRTTLPGLWAVGEVACSGVHGANRLASTSLLEGLVWGVRAAHGIRERPPRATVDEGAIPAWDEPASSYEADPALIHGDMQAVRNVMWHYVGLLRNEHRLARAERELHRLRSNVEDFYRRAHLSSELIGLRNAMLNALIVTRAARHNVRSLGCHHREDFAADAARRRPTTVSDAGMSDPHEL